MTLQLPRPPHDALYNFVSAFDAGAVLHRFHRSGQEPEPGVIVNFLGTRITPAIHPSILAPLAGKVEGLPVPGNWHADIAEWAAALHAVERAQGTFRIVELGCGWGCWMTNTGVAARSIGLEVELIGVEGEAAHLKNAADTLALNGFGPGDFRLVHGVAAPKPGVAIFPRAGAGQTSWGGEALFDPDPAALAEAKGRDDLQVLDCFTIPQLAGDKPVDLLHIDIQGAEAVFVEGNFDAISTHVRRVLIGTHSRAIEGRLTDQFLHHGWRLEMERTAIVTLQDGKPALYIDGVQMWANPSGTIA